MTNRWNWLKERLVTINSNPARFAKDIGWQASRIYELFSGKTKAIPLDKIALAANKLGVSLDSMINFNSGHVDEVQFIASADMNIKNYSASESIPEVDVYHAAPASANSCMLRESNSLYGNISLKNKEVISNWKIPEDYLRELKLQAADTYIFEEQGDSMKPTVSAGDKLIIDTSYRGKSPSPAGIYAIWDGAGICTKRIEMIPNTIPQRVIISADNPNHGSYERKASECCIVGRVVAIIKRL